MTQTTIPNYRRVTIKKASILYNRGVSISLYPSNVNDRHVFEGYTCGYTISNVYGISFDSYVNCFRFYMEPELGRYVKFLAPND